DLHLWQALEETGYYMRSGCNRIAFRMETIAQLGPFLNSVAMQLSFLTNPDVDVAFHASSVQKGERLFLFFARSGSGKSTLAAYFAQHGYRLLSDDTLHFNIRKRHILPVPTASSLKENSYFLGRECQPGFDDLTEYIQDVSGKGHVKYVAPPAIENRPVPLQTFTDATIIFPRYDPGVTTSLRKLEPFDALNQMEVDGFSVREQEISRESVDFFLGLMTAGNTHALDFRDLAEAKAVLERTF
ncbi:MAG: hypothetical protein HQL50_16275, partial [Magnetococcales bacterium]|nr:hypothetical protein [Magnetococcales bacterium]